MSEVQSRPAPSRGRGSGRGGRGGGTTTRASTRPSNRSTATNGDSKHDADSSLPTLDDEGDVGELKQKYGSKVGMIKEMFSDWSDIDILYALQEADGDENLAVTRIADGACHFLIRAPCPLYSRPLFPFPFLCAYYLPHSGRSPTLPAIRHCD